MTADDPQVRVFPHGLEEEALGGPPTVVIDHGFRLVLRFAPGDTLGEGDIQELRVLPGGHSLAPRALRGFAPDAERYIAYARAAMRVFGPDGRDRFRGAAQALREIAGPGRALTDRFYMTVAEHHAALVAEGEPHPVKALGEIHTVTISAASRWVKEARRRGYIEPKKEEK